MIGQVAAAAAGTVAFALLFGVPRKYYGYCSVCGGAGWWLYMLLGGYGCTAAEATFFATVLVIVLSRFFAVWERGPVPVFLISGIVVVFELPHKVFRLRRGKKGGDRL